MAVMQIYAVRALQNSRAKNKN